jgi:putative ubiquitin-RnfH superfamily antitoxin RatB of RatAB toxin-antitoxin module
MRCPRNSIYSVTLQQGATVEEAIRASGLLELRTDIDLSKNKVGYTAVR